MSSWSNPAWSEPARVLLLLGSSGGAYQDVADALQQRLETLSPNAVQLDIQDVSQSDAALGPLLEPPPQLIVSVGTRASALAQHYSNDVPILSLLVSARDYAMLSEAYQRAPHLRSAIYLDQPLNRQLNLTQLLLPKVRQVASLGGPESALQLQELHKLCTDRGLQLAIENVAEGNNPIHPLMRLIDSADVLLALSDPDVFNRTSVQAILLTTYRNQVPVIGFSQAYVRAGAMAAVYSTAQQIGRQAGEWIAELATTGNWSLEEPRYPSYYSVAVNAQVAQSLNISVNTEDRILQQLKDAEKQPP